MKIRVSISFFLYHSQQRILKDYTNIITDILKIIIKNFKQKYFLYEILIF